MQKNKSNLPKAEIKSSWEIVIVSAEWFPQEILIISCANKTNLYAISFSV